MRIAIGIVTNGRKVELRWALALAKMSVSVPDGFDIGLIVHDSWHGDQEQQPFPAGPNTVPSSYDYEQVALSRQRIAERAVVEGYDFLFFLDDDVICSPETLKLLHEQLTANPDVMICGGVYPLKMRSLIPLVFGFDFKPMFDWKSGDVFPCKILATGCMLIRTKVFELLEKPWFKYTTSTGQTEDTYFCCKVAEAGFTTLAHADVLPDHINQDGRVFSIPKQGPNRDMKKMFGIGD